MKSSDAFKMLCGGLVLVVALFGATSPAHAQSIVTGDSVASGQVINDDAILFGDNVVIDGDINGNVIAIGNTVTLNGKVDGSLIALAQDLNINGEVSDSLYAASLTLNLAKPASIARNVTYLGSSVRFPEGASIGRDLKGIFFGAVLGGSLGGDVRAVVGPVEVVRFVLDQFNIQIKLPSLRPTLPAGTPVAPSPTPSSASPYNVKVLAGAMAAGLNQAQQAQSNPVLDFLYSQWLSRQIKGFVTLFILGVLLVLLLPAVLSGWSTKARQSPVLSTGYGLLIMIVGSIAAVILIVLVFALGAGLYAIKLETLAFLTLALGSTAVGLAYATFYLFTTFFSKIVVTFLVGWLILRRWDRASRWWMLLPFLLGLLLYSLVVAIPFLGFAISVVVAAMGTGAIYMSLVPAGRRMFSKEEPAPAVVAPEAPPQPPAPVEEEPAASPTPAPEHKSTGKRGG